MDPLTEAYNYFLGQGYDSNAAAGIAGGLYAESGLNPNAVNPSSGAYGIEQALGSRQSGLFSEYGSSPTYEQQLAYVAQELPNNGGATIASASSPQSALSSFISLFERPAAGAETTGDITRGTNAIAQLGLTGNNTIVSGAESLLSQGEALIGVGSGTSTSSGTAATPGGATGLFAPIINWWNSFLSGIEGGIENAFARGGFAIVGIILLAAGIFILASNSKTVQSGVRAAASVA